MSPDNPYEAPQVDVSAASGHSGPAQPASWQDTLFSFRGRVPRRVFWGVSLGITFIFYAVVFALAAILGQDSGLLGIVILLMYIPLVWISLAVTVKRWHDRDKSGWWILIGLIPLIGAIWQFVECGCLRGTVGGNQYGGDPT